MSERLELSLLAGKRVLLAEDSHTQRLLISFHLTRAGIDLTAVEDGRAAVECGGRETFDAILLDMHMPYMDGYEAATRLREQGFRGPILALTAGSPGEDEQTCLDAGCDGYVEKSEPPTKLLEILAGYLTASPAARSFLPSPPETSYEDLRREYMAGLTSELHELQAALAAGNRTTLAALAHQTRGTAAMYGFPDLGEAAGLLEDAANEGQDLVLLHELVDEIADMVRRISERTT